MKIEAPGQKPEIFFHPGCEKMKKIKLSNLGVIDINQLPMAIVAIFSIMAVHNFRIFNGCPQYQPEITDCHYSYFFTQDKNAKPTWCCSQRTVIWKAAKKSTGKFRSLGDGRARTST